MPIKQFVQEKGLTFKAGKGTRFAHSLHLPPCSSSLTSSLLCPVLPRAGFYEFTKPEQVSAKKLIVLQKKTTGELFEGRSARRYRRNHLSE